MKMIEVHAEVFAVSPVFVTRVTQKVIEAVSEELTRLIQCVTEHGPYSPAQVTGLRRFCVVFMLYFLHSHKIEVCIYVRPGNSTKLDGCLLSFNLI